GSLVLLSGGEGQPAGDAGVGAGEGLAVGKGDDVVGVRLAEFGEGELEGAAGDGLGEVAEADEGLPQLGGVDAVSEGVVDGAVDGALALCGGVAVLLPPLEEDLLSE